MKQKFFAFTWVMFGLIVAALAGLEYLINKEDHFTAQKQYKLVVNDETLKNAKDERTKSDIEKGESLKENNVNTEKNKETESKTAVKSEEKTA